MCYRLTLFLGEPNMRFTFDGSMCGSFPGSRGGLLVTALAAFLAAFLAILGVTEVQHGMCLLSVTLPPKRKRPDRPLLICRAFQYGEVPCRSTLG